MFRLPIWLRRVAALLTPPPVQACCPGLPSVHWANFR